nr:MAG TPA: hypothetical protein [Caudoviricetes sp.]
MRSCSGVAPPPMGVAEKETHTRGYIYLQFPDT